MRVRRRTVMLAAAALGLLGAGGVLAQSSGTYGLHWNAITGGGGTSSGGAYAVTGNVGIGGGPFASGSYSVRGGYLAGSADVKFKAYLPMLSREP